MTLKNSRNDQLLTDVSTRRGLGNLVFNMILTPKSVVQYTGKIGSYGNDHLRLVNTVTGGEQGYMRIATQTKSSQTYAIESHGLKDILTDEDYQNELQPFDAQSDTVEALTDLMNLTKEHGLASVMNDVSVITQNVTLSGTDQWSDYDNSNPLADILTALEAVRVGCGRRPNKTVCDYAVALKLRFHPKILAELGFTANKVGGATDEDLARVLGISKFIVADSTYNDSKQGQADNMVPVWGKGFIAFYSEDKAAKKQVTLGYHLELKKNGKKVVVKPQDEPLDSDKVMISDKYEQLISNTGAAYLIAAAIA